MEEKKKVRDAQRLKRMNEIKNKQSTNSSISSDSSRRSSSRDRKIISREGSNNHSRNVVKEKEQPKKLRSNQSNMNIHKQKSIEKQEEAESDEETKAMGIDEANVDRRQ